LPSVSLVRPPSVPGPPLPHISRIVQLLQAPQKNSLSTIKNAAVKPHDRQFFLINPSIDGAAEKIHHKLHFDTKDFLESSEVEMTASRSGEIGKNRPPA
jgi:hypothetical protein